MLQSILRVAVVSAIGISTVACSVSEQRVAGYGLGGAALGALAGTALIGGAAEAALAGATVGAIAGTVTGVAANQKKQPNIIVQQPPLCTYHGRGGQVYQAPCPQKKQVPKLCTYRDEKGVMYRAPCPK
ncbi:hypothetical protein V4P56_05195 [Bartonella sp. B35(2025)]